MLTHDVHFEGWAASDWTRFLSLFHVSRAVTPDPDERGGVIAMYEGDRLRKLLHTRVGRLPFSEQPWPVSLAELAQTHRARWVVSLHTGALEEVMDRFGERAQPDDDIAMQALSLLQILRELNLVGQIETWPTQIRAFPFVGHAVLTRALEGFCPVGRVALMGIFENGDLWTSIAIRRRIDGIDLVLGPDQLRPAMGLLSGDWRRDYRHLVRTVEEYAGPLAFGFFTEAPILRTLLENATPGAWARATAIRDIVLSPIPTAVALPLGLDAARGLITAARTLAERYIHSGSQWAIWDSLPSAGSSQQQTEQVKNHAKAAWANMISMVRRFLDEL